MEDKYIVWTYPMSDLYDEIVYNSGGYYDLLVYPLAETNFKQRWLIKQQIIAEYYGW